MAEKKEMMPAVSQSNPIQFYADPAAVAAAESARARIQAAYQVALYNPRNTDKARDRILKNCKRPAFAERVEYSKPVSGKKMRGPSIRFAELAIREWGNILTETQIVYESLDTRRVKLIVTDLETNSTHAKELLIEKTVERKEAGKDREILGERMNTKNEKVFIVRATEDEIHNKEAAMISKALRNEGLRLIPSDVIDEAIETARVTLANDSAQDPEAAKKKVLDSFSSIGVGPVELARWLGHATDQLVPAELSELRSMFRAIKDGEARWSDYFSDETRSNQPPTRPTDIKMEDILAGEVKTEPDKAPVAEAEKAPYPTSAGAEVSDGFEPSPDQPGQASEPPRDTMGDEKIIEQFRTNLGQCKQPAEVMKYMKEVKSQKVALCLSDELIGKMAQIANDRTRELLKAQAAQVK